MVWYGMVDVCGRQSVRVQLRIGTMSLGRHCGQAHYRDGKAIFSAKRCAKTHTRGRGNQTAGGVGGVIEVRQRNLGASNLGLCVREHVAGRAND